MDFALNSRQLELRDVARQFAINRLRPAAERLDRLEDPASTYPEALIEEASDLGLRTLGLPERYGGSGTDALTEVLVLEELCYGDAGFGMTLAHPWREGRMLAELGTEAQRERFLTELIKDRSFVTALAITEEHSGSDNALPYTASLDAVRRTTAIRQGDHWILNGRKRWITSGNVAKLILVVARTDASVPWPEGISMFIVSREAPGLRVGMIEDKLGLRLNQNAELIFEDCAIPHDQALGEINGAAPILRSIGPSSKAKEGAKSLGIGRAALDAGRQWPRPGCKGGASRRAPGDRQQQGRARHGAGGREDPGLAGGVGQRP